MYTGPTPMPVRGGPHTTSLIDDLTVMFSVIILLLEQKQEAF